VRKRRDYDDRRGCNREKGNVQLEVGRDELRSKDARWMGGKWQGDRRREGDGVE